MPKGGSCSFCVLAPEHIDHALALWREGAGGGTISKALLKRGVRISPQIVDNCLSKSKHFGARQPTGEPFDPVGRLGRIADLLERSGINPAEVGKIQSVRLSEWQGLTKNEAGEAELHDLKGASIVLSPEWADGPRWQPVDRGAPVVIKPPPKLRKRVDPPGLRRAFCIPDAQIGFWRDISTGHLTSFHDEAAIATMLAVLELVDQPDMVIIGGDFVDLAPLSDKFTREAGFALTVQPALDYAVWLLQQLRARAPEAKFVFLEGNHDRRLQKAITNNNLECFGVRRGGSAPDEWPVFSVPNLLRMDELGVEYVGGYPAGEYWINENLVTLHGSKVRSGNQSTAAAIIEDERVSVIFNHTHRIEKKHKTRRVADGRRHAQAVSFGCLCKLDGSVPSTKGSTDVFGRPVPTVEDWQHGCGLVTFEEGDGAFSIEDIPLYTARTTFFRGTPVEVAAA